MSSCDCTPIIDNIYLGGKCCSQNADFIEDKKINVIFNVTQSTAFSDVCPTCKRYRIEVEDTLQDQDIQNMYSGLIKYVPILRAHVEEGDRILVHCFAGIQRSATLIVGYLMKYHGLNPIQAMEYIRQRRSIAFFPKANFLSAINRYWESLS